MVSSASLLGSIQGWTWRGLDDPMRLVCDTPATPSGDGSIVEDNFYILRDVAIFWDSNVLTEPYGLES